MDLIHTIRGTGEPTWIHSCTHHFDDTSVDQTEARNGHSTSQSPPPISVTDFLCTVDTVLGIDHTRRNHPPGVDRPIPTVDSSQGFEILSDLL
jgi:hypothetical protein